MDEARYLCDFIEYKMAELAALKASTAPTAGLSWLATPPPPPPPPPAAQGEQGLETEVASIVEEPTAFLALLEDNKGWSADESWEAMDGSNVDKMLASSVKPSTAAKYGRIWDKWVLFATSHNVNIMPPEVRALEIFIADTAELSGSAGVATTAAAAVAHFCALEGFASLFGCPRFGKILRGIRSSFGKAATPRKPFLPEHIVSFMLLARRGTLREWRSALPLVLCYQQLLRGAECFDLNGSHVERLPAFFRVEIATSKNHPEGFSFRIPVNDARPNCVGVFLADFITVMGIQLGHKDSFLACKIAKFGGVLRTRPTEKLATSSMRGCCKDLIIAAGLDPSAYATHSSKRGGTLEAMKAGLSDAQIQELGRWSSSTMVARYARGDEEMRESLTDSIRI
jgi:hypothetical protein